MNKQVQSIRLEIANNGYLITAYGYEAKATYVIAANITEATEWVHVLLTDGIPTRGEDV